MPTHEQPKLLHCQHMTNLSYCHGMPTHEYPSYSYSVTPHTIAGYYCVCHMSSQEVRTPPLAIDTVISDFMRHDCSRVA